MKIKELFYMLGLKPKPRLYGFEIEEQHVGRHGVIRYAQWLHPKGYRCRFTEEEIDEHMRFVQPGDFCIDIGAHCGDSCLPAAIAAGPEGCVLAMEPNRYLFPVLEENTRLASERVNIVPLMAAAMQEPGTYTFGYSEPGFCNGGDVREYAWWRQRRMFPLEVEGINLDHLLRTEYADRLDRLRYIKTDTEGNDLYVLQSIAELIKQHRPYLQVEVFKYSTASQRQELHGFLSKLGYDIRIVQATSTLLGESTVTADDLCQADHCDIFCTPNEAATIAA